MSSTSTLASLLTFKGDLSELGFIEPLLNHVILSTALGGRCYCSPNFGDQATEAYRG